MLMTTTPSVENRRIREYKGIVTGEAIVGANIFNGMLMVAATGTAVVLE
jgi:uncharacterized protein YbjQ (UPF0145 family)